MTWPFPVSSRSVLKPERTEICPKCNGSCRAPCSDQDRPFGVKHGWFDYDAATDTVKCDNCGGQYMYGKPTGRVFPRRDGSGPCLHEYEGQQVRNCYYVYTCKHCPDRYDLDSGD